MFSPEAEAAADVHVFMTQQAAAAAAITYLSLTMELFSRRR